MSGEKMNRFIDFVMGSDQDFYDTYLVNLSEEELDVFMRNNPDFAAELETEKMKRENIKQENMKRDGMKQGYEAGAYETGEEKTRESEK